MKEFHLRIVTPDGSFFDGTAESIKVRTIDGDICVRARHTNFVSALGMGMAELIVGGKERYAACMGGMISVLEGEVSLAATTFEWAEEIDYERSQKAEQRAREILDQEELNDTQLALAEARLKRALVRQQVFRIGR